MPTELPGAEVAEQINVIYTDRSEEIDGLPEKMHGVARQLQGWLGTMREKADSMVTRQTYTDADDVIEQMKMARKVAEQDDIVANTLEVREGLAFQGLKWESPDFMTTDVFNQMAAEQNLDEFVRKCWRELETCSQVVVAAWWDTGTFKVRGKTKRDNKRKATKEIWYPSRFSILDSTKVIPVGALAFGMEDLAWDAEPWEKEHFKAVAEGKATDDAVKRFYLGSYQLTPNEMREIRGKRDGVLPGTNVTGDELIMLNGRYVTRHTLTRPDYQRWAPIRMRSVFRLVDMKHHLMAADRVALIGAANYILLVKKGDKDNPAHQEEVDNLKENFKVIAKIPVIFSDHRLEIEIVTPKQDYTLQREKYDLLDQRILARLMNSLPKDRNSSGGGDETLSSSTTVSRALEGRRHMLKRYLEKEIARAVVEHPKNEGIFTEGPPSLTYFPAKIRLVSDAALGQQIISLRTQREISRETTLEFFGFDQAVEAVRREFEADRYDDIFKTQVPFSSPDGQVPADQGGAGGEGGRPDGGGKTSQNPTKTNVTDKGTTSTKQGE